MSFKYSICYPDKDEISYPPEPINKENVQDLIRKFDQDSELKKEIDYYSPSLDFINIANKRRLILSGIGKGKLEEFLITYILPNDENAKATFSDENYYKAEEYYETFSIKDSEEILKLFLDERYDRLKFKIKGTKMQLSNIKAINKHPNRQQ